MNLPPEKKPSLSELFVSKKLDVPSDEFWNTFQDEVRSKTLSSVVVDDSKARFYKYLYCTVAVIMISFFSYTMIKTDNVNIPTIATKSNALNINSSEIVTLSITSTLQNKSMADLDLISTLDSENSNNFGVGSFVEQNYFASSLETSFQHRVLVQDTDYSGDLKPQFTF